MLSSIALRFLDKFQIIFSDINCFNVYQEVLSNFAGKNPQKTGGHGEVNKLCSQF